MMDNVKGRMLAVIVKGGTQQQAAEAAGVSARTVRRWLLEPSVAAELQAAKGRVVVDAAVVEKSTDLKEMLLNTAGMLSDAAKTAAGEGDRKNLAPLAREAISAAMAYLRAIGQLGPDSQTNIQINNYAESPAYKEFLVRFAAAVLELEMESHARGLQDVGFIRGILAKAVQDASQS